MNGLQVAAVVALLLVLAVVAAAGLGLSRWHSLTRRVGSFSCTLRRDPRWVPGVAHYGARSLYWWRLWSLAPRPEHVWPRGGIAVLDRHATDGSAGFSGPLLVRCRVESREVELVMSPEAYAGLTSWLEAAPPVARTVI
ncbi:MAG TPA: DUF2550 domain-containing protein [Cellulomonas sp.]